MINKPQFDYEYQKQFFFSWLDFVHFHSASQKITIQIMGKPTVEFIHWARKWCLSKKCLKYCWSVEFWFFRLLLFCSIIFGRNWFFFTVCFTVRLSVETSDWSICVPQAVQEPHSKINWLLLIFNNYFFNGNIVFPEVDTGVQFPIQKTA